MILSLGRDSSSFQYSYLLCLEAEVDKTTLLQRAKVKPESYAGELIGGLHLAIFYCSLELKHDYGEYYSIEYATFAEYLRKRFRFAPEFIDRVSAQFSQSEKIIYFHPTYCFLEDTYGRLFLERLLEPGRTK